MNVTAARPAQLAAVKALVAASGLPSEDLTAEHLRHFWVWTDAAAIVGVVGLEPRGREALLRSLAVREDRRGGGIGGRLAALAESEAAVLGIDTLYLLTTSAERFFAARGYAVIPRDATPPAIRDTAEFAGICPSSAICMTKRLAG